MANTYRIYFGNKPFYISNVLTPDMQQLTDAGCTLVINQPTDSCVQSCIHDLDKTDADAAIILSSKPDYYFQLLQSKFQTITAGGGLVKNENGEYLFIFRRGKWDLPKGKLDEGETIEACALREVQEETGLQHVQLMAPLITTWHTYHERGQFLLKESVWYRMEASTAEALVPQTEEDIQTLQWVAPQDIPALLDNTFPSIVDVLKAEGIVLKAKS